ncbi:MAG: hypothetical protein K0R40_105 [Burkholderiales bacterium]|nr:hypothetical protein [Burkholderiales bacterium]
MAKLAGIKEGPAVRRVRAKDGSLWKWFGGNETVVQKKFDIDIIPPTLQLIAEDRYINFGGAGDRLQALRRYGDERREGRAAFLLRHQRAGEGAAGSLCRARRHLSSIDVKEGEKLEQRQVLGRTGETGLAGATTCTTEESVAACGWWDPKWIKDNIQPKLDGLSGDAIDEMQQPRRAAQKRRR